MLLKFLWNVEESIDNSCKTRFVRPSAMISIRWIGYDLWPRLAFYWLETSAKLIKTKTTRILPLNKRSDLVCSTLVAGKVTGWIKNMQIMQIVQQLQNFKKKICNNEHKKCYCAAHWWWAKWQVECWICKIRKCAIDAKSAGLSTYAKCALAKFWTKYAKTNTMNATSMTKILGVQHIGGKVTGWM